MKLKSLSLAPLALVLSTALAVGEHHPPANGGAATDYLGSHHSHSSSAVDDWEQPAATGEMMMHMMQQMNGLGDCNGASSHAGIVVQVAMQHGDHETDMDHRAGMTHAGPGSDAQGLAQLQGEAFEQAFLAMMLAHHEGAVEMSTWVLEHGSDTRVQAAAEEIIAAQMAEIELMRGWLQEWFQQEPAQEWLGAMAGDMTAMMEAMKADSDADRAFLVGMIEHHQGAIDMAQLALERAEHAELRELARAVIVLQAQEVHGYVELLDETW